MTSIFGAYLQGHGIDPTRLLARTEAAGGSLRLPATDGHRAIFIRSNPLILDVEEIEYRKGVRWKGSPHQYLIVDGSSGIMHMVVEGCDAGTATGVAELSGHRIDRVGEGRGGSVIAELAFREQIVRTPLDVERDEYYPVTTAG